MKSRIEKLKNLFANLPSAEDRYNYLIELGRALPPYPAALKTTDRIVPGCQSTLYFATSYEHGRLSFAAHSDSLISAGLAALLISIYSDSTPKDILLTPPAFLQELGIFASLSPNRSSGLASIYTRIKQESLRYLGT